METEETTLNTIDKKRLNYFGPVQQMLDNITPKAMINWQPDRR